MLSTLIKAGPLQTIGRQLARSVETPVQIQHVRSISKSSEVNSDYMTMRENQSQKTSRDYNSKMQLRLKKVSRWVLPEQFRLFRDLIFSSPRFFPCYLFVTASKASFSDICEWKSVQCNASAVGKKKLQPYLLHYIHKRVMKVKMFTVLFFVSRNNKWWPLQPGEQSRPIAHTQFTRLRNTYQPTFSSNSNGGVVREDCLMLCRFVCLCLPVYVAFPV